jgi:hypothetical protein
MAEAYGPCSGPLPEFQKILDERSDFKMGDLSANFHGPNLNVNVDRQIQYHSCTDKGAPGAPDY